MRSIEFVLNDTNFCDDRCSAVVWEDDKQGRKEVSRNLIGSFSSAASGGDIRRSTLLFVSNNGGQLEPSLSIELQSLFRECF